MQKLFFLILLWFFACVAVYAQAPAADLDSITEDSYRRMLERQAAEIAADTLLIEQSDSVLVKGASKKSDWFYILIVVSVITSVLLIHRYYRRIFKTKDISKE